MLLSLSAASLNLLPWWLRLCGIVQMASQSGWTYNSYSAGCLGFMAINKPCPRAFALGLSLFTAINPRHPYQGECVWNVYMPYVCHPCSALYTMYCAQCKYSAQDGDHIMVMLACSTCCPFPFKSGFHSSIRFQKMTSTNVISVSPSVNQQKPREREGF